MTPTGQRLARVQVDGHRAISAIYGSLSIAIAAAVMRRATPDQRGILRLSLLSRAAILVDVGRLLDEARLLVYDAVFRAMLAAEQAAQNVVEPLPYDFTTTRIALFEVAPALRTDRSSVISQTGSLLVRGIAAKAAATQVAKTVKEYFFKRDPQSGLIQTWPGRANMASQHPRLVMLTETTAAHGRITKRIAERDELGLKWVLSPGHVDADECDDHAQRSSRGQDRGVYLPSEFPKIPQHPRCRCFSSAVELSAR